MSPKETERKERVLELYYLDPGELDMAVRAAKAAAAVRIYKQDPDEKLLRRVCDLTNALGRIPKVCEMAGSPYIKSRLGGWNRVLEKAGLKTVSPKRAACPSKKK
ncbi:homing endonuclease associated repeat-containing protein [Bacilliculturomica massiliensis]|uniref:homing endonuclease associated repeat-containing protein n=1 Tax=Bacilliculturomica massiliensis TaxID=1917867 RepID=UPI0010311479|nr:hypothetical protein [Bacilliculturomica massiliensis]